MCRGFVAVPGGALLRAPVMCLGRPQGAHHQWILFSLPEFLITGALFPKGRIMYSGLVLQST